MIEKGAEINSPNAMLCLVCDWILAYQIDLLKPDKKFHGP